MERVLFTWLDKENLTGITSKNRGCLEQYSIYTALNSDRIKFDKLIVLSAWNSEGIQKHGDPRDVMDEIKLAFDHVDFELKSQPKIGDDPANWQNIYNFTCQCIEEVIKKQTDHEIYFLFSAGSRYVTANWIFLNATKYPNAHLVRASDKKGVSILKLPFDISAEYLPEQVVREISGLSDASEFSSIIHRSKEMVKSVSIAQKFAKYDVPVFLQGESGVGKELFARAIHNSSSRRKQPFVAVNCAAIPPSLIESELFGHKKGAFTGAISDKKGKFELAHMGTLFLDEIGELQPDLQAKLLRALADVFTANLTIMPVGTEEETEVNVRVIAATNVNILDEIKKGKFREDLFYRINVAFIKIPSVKERKGDITLLVDHFIDDLGKKLQKKAKLSPSARNALLNYHWPGNVREMIAVLARMLILAESNKITESDIKQYTFESQSNPNGEIVIVGDNFSFDQKIAEIAKQYLIEAHNMSNGRKSKAAKLLGLKNHQALDSKLKSFGLNNKLKWKTRTIRKGYEMTNEQIDRISAGIEKMERGKKMLLSDIFGLDEWEKLPKGEKLSIGKEFHGISSGKYGLQSLKKSDNHWLYWKV